MKKNSNVMTRFILGYLPEDDVTPEALRIFPDMKTADFESEEWVSINAETEQQARKNYERKFAQWQKDPDNYDDNVNV